MEDCPICLTELCPGENVWRLGKPFFDSQNDLPQKEGFALAKMGLLITYIHCIYACCRFRYIIYDICIILIDFSLRRDDWMDVAILSTDPALIFGSSAEQIVHSARLRQTRWDYGVLHGSTV